MLGDDEFTSLWSNEVRRTSKCELLPPRMTTRTPKREREADGSTNSSKLKKFNSLLQNSRPSPSEFRQKSPFPVFYRSSNLQKIESPSFSKTAPFYRMRGRVGSRGLGLRFGRERTWAWGTKECGEGRERGRGEHRSVAKHEGFCFSWVLSRV